MYSWAKGFLIIFAVCIIMFSTVAWGGNLISLFLLVILWAVAMALLFFTVSRKS
jgi:hypothetical protein